MKPEDILKQRLAERDARQAAASESSGRKREHREEDETNPESLWLIPYGNMMTVLMVLFLILYSFTFNQNSSSYEKVLTQLQSEFTKLDKKAQQKFEAKQKESQAATEIADYLSEKGLDKLANVDVNAQRIRIQLATPVLFDSGDAELKLAAASVMDEIAEMLQKVPNKVIVEGHTDNIPISTPKYANNWELSVDRAINVINYMNKLGIPSERFAAAGYGEFQPVDSNDTLEGRSKNRRIEFIIVRT
jgi:chemotaxis protein MotB